MLLYKGVRCLPWCPKSPRPCPKSPLTVRSLPEKSRHTDATFNDMSNHFYMCGGRVGWVCVCVCVCVCFFLCLLYVVCIVYILCCYCIHVFV